mgnify:CR=1 FL=1
MEWKEVRLGDVCTKIGSGATPSGGKEAYKGGDYHLIRSQNVLDFAFSKDGLASINDEQANKLKNVEIIQGDVLLNITGDSVARCCIVPSEILPARVNQHVAIIRPRKEELDNNYLLYYLQYYKRQLLQIASAGATRNAITKAMIENLILPCPKNLADQRRIASILSSLDRKIELNNKINADLEEMAQAIFKNWFVDFEPFKDGKFVDSELGMIPEGWKVGTLGDITKNKSAKVKERNDVKVLSPVTTGELVLSEEYFTKQVFSSSIAKYKIVNKGDFAYNPARVNIGSLGRNEFDFDGCVSPVYVVFSVLDGYENYFDLFRKTDFFKDSVASLAIGGVRQSLSYDDLSSIVVIIPSENAVEEFNNLYNQMKKTIKANKLENSRLSTLRDTLLPRLMSGEIEVPE